MHEILELILQHGALVLFVWVFANQAGVPVPVAPSLLAAGALAGAGRLSLLPPLAIAVGASLLADLLWYGVGWRYGAQALAWLSRLSLRPDTSVRRAEELFVAHRLPTLLIAKFLPELNPLAAGLAGTVRTPLGRYVFYAAGSALGWAGAWMGLGFVFSDVLEGVALRALQLGIPLILLLVGAFAGYIAVKYAQRQRLLRTLRIARISIDELAADLGNGKPMMIVDLRTEFAAAATPYVIPGALRIRPEELARRHAEIPRDVEVVLYCTCPNEATSAQVALALRKHGITRIRPLVGGLEAWRARGLPLEPLGQPVPADPVVTAARSTLRQMARPVASTTSRSRSLVQSNGLGSSVPDEVSISGSRNSDEYPNAPQRRRPCGAT